MSKRNQLEKFQPQFVTKIIEKWVNASLVYQKEAENSYRKLRSYLTMYQFRLTDQEKREIRDMLSSQLDKIDNNDQVDDMDSYLDGFCFQMDTSIIERQNETQPDVTMATQEPINSISEPNDTTMHSVFNDHMTVDHNDLDIYTMQFFQ